MTKARLSCETLRVVKQRHCMSRFGKGIALHC